MSDNDRQLVNDFLTGAQTGKQDELDAAINRGQRQMRCLFMETFSPSAYRDKDQDRPQAKEMDHGEARNERRSVCQRKNSHHNG